MNIKKNWDLYFMKITEMVSKRATCDRKHVGAIIVKDKRILATGYNGSMSGAEECDEVGHMMEDSHCARTVHAEINAITQCAKYGISCNGASIYINTFPCWDCFKTIVNAGIREIYYEEEYESELKSKVQEYATKLRIKLSKVYGFTTKEKEQIVINFVEELLGKQTDLPPEAVKVLNEHFWELI